MNRTATQPLTHADCLDHYGQGCSGNVEYRTPLSGTGKSFARCDGHWEIRLAEHERIQRDYPDSPLAPAWFDEAAAGERWDDD